MELSTVIILYVIALLVLIFGGLPIAFALGLIAVGSLYLGLGPDMAPALARVTWSGLADFVLCAIPLFIFMGYLLFETGLSRLVYDAVYPTLERLLPGGLLHSNIVVGAIFAACCGSSLATCASIGSVALPEMEKRGYERGIAAGSVAAGGTLGILIPPSITMIVYGAMTDTSVGKLFIGGIIPGLILTVAYMLYIALRIKARPGLLSGVAAPVKLPWTKCLLALVSVWPILFVIVGVLGSIYAGLATPTESAAIGCALVFILAAFYRLVTWKSMKQSIAGSVSTASMLLCIFLGAKLMGIYLSNAQIPGQLATMVTSLGLPPLAIFAAVYVFYLILGMLMDSLAMMVMTIAITFPIVTGVGYDAVWYGVIMTMLCEAGLLTPPVGMNLFIIKGLRPDYPFMQIVKGCFPFFLVLTAVSILMVAFPDMITFLPRTMIGK